MKHRDPHHPIKRPRPRTRSPLPEDLLRFQSDRRPRDRRDPLLELRDSSTVLAVEVFKEEHLVVLPRKR